MGVGLRLGLGVVSGIWREGVCLVLGKVVWGGLVSVRLCRSHLMGPSNRYVVKPPVIDKDFLFDLDENRRVDSSNNLEVDVMV